MWLKLLAPAAILVTALLEFYLSNKWRDRRTKTNRRATRALLVVLILSSVATGAIVVTDELENRRLLDKITGLENAARENEEAAKLRESTAQKERQDLKAELSALEKTLEPVAQIATAKYPTLDLASAVLRLMEDVEQLEVRLQNEVARIRDLSLDVRIHFRGIWGESGRPTELNWAMWGSNDKAGLKVITAGGEARTINLVAVGRPTARVGEKGGFVAYTAEVRTGDWPLGEQLAGECEVLGGWALVTILKGEWFRDKKANVVQLDISIRSNGAERDAFKIPMNVDLRFQGRQHLEWKLRRKVRLTG